MLDTLSQRLRARTFSQFEKLVTGNTASETTCARRSPRWRTDGLPPELQTSCWVVQVSLHCALLPWAAVLIPSPTDTLALTLLVVP